MTVSLAYLAIAPLAEDFSPLGVKNRVYGLLSAVDSSKFRDCYQRHRNLAMVNFIRNTFNVVVAIFLITFIILNLFQLGKFFLTSLGVF